MLYYLKKIKSACFQMYWHRKNRISQRTTSGKFRVGRDTLFCPNRLDFTQDGSIHLGTDSHIMASISTRKNEAVISIGDRCFIGIGSSIVAALGVTIGNDVLIGGECYISDNDGHSLDLEIRKDDLKNSNNRFKLWNGIGVSVVVIEDNAWIAPRCIILKGVTIGRGSVIGAGSVVTKSVPPMTLAAGNPAKFIKSL